VHEAGHAVVAVELKDRFKTVDIVANERRAGGVHRGLYPKFMREGCTDDARLFAWIERRILVEFAGGMAQRRHAPRSNWAYGMGHDGLEPDLCYDDGADTYHVKAAYGSDLCHIDKWLRRLGRHGDDVYRSKLEARAKALVREQWPAIRRVAAALLKKKVLSQADVRRLMNRARRHLRSKGV
jgi:hypothetical protein